MKKILSVILILGMLLGVCAAAEEAKQPAGNRLGFEVLRMLSDGAENRVFSPVSLAYALAMAAEGAEGDTRAEILGALGGDPAEVAAMTDALAAAGQKLANAGFAAGDAEFEETYISALREQFGAEWFVGEEDPAGAINAWVKEHTDGLIEKMLDGGLSGDTRLVLLNAIAMDAKWVDPFDPEATAEDVFHAPDGDVTAEFMHQRGWMEYGEREGVQMLRLRYLNEAEDGLSGLSMMIALPEEGGVPAVLDGLCAEGLEYFAFDETNREVILSMPRVDLSSDVTLNEALKALGIEKAFAEEADFSGMTEAEKLYIGDVRQKARLIMDEEGTKAAAATMIAMCGTALPSEPPVEFDMNRPFVVVIADEVSGAVCFAGVIANPSAN